MLYYFSKMYFGCLRKPHIEHYDCVCVGMCDLTMNLKIPQAPQGLNLALDVRVLAINCLGKRQHSRGNLTTAVG